MGKISAVNIGDTGTAAKDKINEAMQTVESDSTLSGDGTAATPLGVNTITASKISDPENLFIVESISVAISDMTTDLTVAASLAYFRCPYDLTLLSIAASVGTAPTGANIIIDANDGKAGTSIMTTNKCVIEVNETDTLTATTQPTLTTTSFSAGDQIWFDIDQIGSSTAGNAAQVHLSIQQV